MGVIEKKANNTLCDDIIEQILCRTPVKSLLRFKTVCKSWSNLISTPRFVYNNHAVSCEHNASRIHVVNYGSSYRAVERAETSISNGLPWWFSVPPLSDSANRSDIQLVEISTPFNTPVSSIDIAGSCNGLLFLIIEGNAFIWNPSIRQHVQLPPTNAIRGSIRCQSISGLGYNSVSDEYKAVLFLYECMYHWRARGSQLLVYSSRGGCWKEVGNQDVPYCLCETCHSGVVVNGYPHWIVRRYNGFPGRSKPIIMFFDTKHENLKILPTPCNFDPWSLTMLRRCLCASGKNLSDSGTTDIWAMKEYGVEDSWTKLFVIQDSIISSRFSIVPLGFLNHGDDAILEVDWRKIVTYNLKRKEKKFVVGTTKSSTQCDRFESVEYVTSLVSPKSFHLSHKRKRSGSDSLQLAMRKEFEVLRHCDFMAWLE